MLFGNITNPDLIRCFICFGFLNVTQLPIGPSGLPGFLGKNSSFRINATTHALRSSDVRQIFRLYLYNKTELCKGCTISNVVTDDSNRRWNDFVTMRKLEKAHASIILITSVFGIIGNAVVLSTHLANYREITTFRLLICHLAASDLLFATTQILKAVPTFREDYQQEDVIKLQEQLQEQKQSASPENATAQRIKHYQWPFGKTGCKFTRTSYLAGSVVAVGTILLIALERYQGIMNPMKAGLDSYKRTKLGIGLGLIWIITTVSVVPVWVASDVIDNECAHDWESHLGQSSMEGYRLFVLIAFCLVPATALSILYGRIIRWLRHSHGIKTTLSIMAAQNRKERDMRVIKLLLAVVILFFICVLPIRIMEVVLTFVDHTKLSKATFFSVVYCGLIPYPFHVATNPIIYSFVDLKFRQTLLRLLCRRNVNNSSRQSTQATSSKDIDTKKRVPLLGRRTKEGDGHELNKLSSNTDL